jgi:hypothetical protein
LIAALLALLSCAEPPALRQEAWIWQGQRGAALEASIQSHRLDGLLVLMEEWTTAGERRLEEPGGLPPDAGRVLRLDAAVPPGPGLEEALSKLLHSWAQRWPQARELQLDIDVPRSQLFAYAAMLERLARQAGPPLSATALPDWLRDPEGARALSLALAGEAGLVYQLHSLPAEADCAHPGSLIEESTVQEALERASRLGQPFRVALPLYEYVLACDAQGRRLGIGAEGRELAPGRQGAVVGADPALLARLLSRWSRRPPPGLTGVVWFRLPVEGDLHHRSMSELEQLRRGQWHPAAEQAAPDDTKAQR